MFELKISAPTVPEMWGQFIAMADELREAGYYRADANPDATNPQHPALAQYVAPSNPQPVAAPYSQNATHVQMASPIAYPAPTAMPAPTQPPIPTAAPTYTANDLMTAGAQLMARVGMPAMQQLLTRFGVPGINQLPPERYGEFAQALRDMGGTI